LADAAEADHSQGFASELGKVRIFPEAEILAVLPITTMCHEAVLGGFFEEIEDDGENEFRHGIGAVNGDVGNGDVMLGGIVGIDDVVSGREDGNEFEIRKLGEGCRVQRAFVGENDIGIFRALNDLVDRGARINGEFAEFLNFSPRVVAGVESMAIEDGDFHLRVKSEW